MKRLSGISLMQLALTVLLVFAFAAQLRAEPAQRIVSVGGSVTEIIYALGQEHRLVARDTTSNHPPATLELPDVGYVRRLSPEGLLSVEPDLILAEDGAGPPETLDILHESKIPIVTIPMGYDRDAVLAKIRAVADALDVSEQGTRLAEEVGNAIDAAVAENGLIGKRVLFVLAMQGGRILAGGSNTAAEGVINLAGAKNAVQGFEGYKLLTDEAILTAAPDVILLMSARGPRFLSDEDLLSNPALAATPAGQSRAVLRMDGLLLLGFSVRTGQAVSELAAQLSELGS